MPTMVLGNEVVTPTEAESAQAQQLSRALSPHVGEGSVRIQLKTGKASEELVLPPSAVRVLVGILNEMGRGNSVSVSPIQAELSPSQAAELLNVSRPYVTKLLDQGEIPHRMVGTHHRIRLQDLLEYKRKTLAEQYTAADELTALSQELGLYDDPIK